MPLALKLVGSSDRGIRREANRPAPGSSPAPGKYSVRARNVGAVRHHVGALIPELPVVQRELEIAGVQGGATALRA